MTENYLCIYPSGDVAWVNLDRVKSSFGDYDTLDLRQCYDIIGCECVEHVRTVLLGISLLVDESGRIKHPPQRHNELASRLYAGFLLGYHDIVGPVIVCALRRIEPYGEEELFPLSEDDLFRLSVTLDLKIPDL